MGRFEKMTDMELCMLQTALLIAEDAGLWDEVMVDLLNEIGEEKNRRGL